jgi:TPP-dependent pyruvate/acetoin dehydrogenase alpha subunit
MVRFAEAHKIACEVIDGNDVVAVATAAKALVERARTGDGPGFLEAITYRWRGHVGPREDIDVGLRRSRQELASWKKRDPIRRLTEALEARGDLQASAVTRLETEILGRVTAAVADARAAPWPDKSALLGPVYVNG